MKLSSLPARITAAFASGASSSYARDIPAMPTGIQGQASLQLGFPPATFTPGSPPFGQDVNGILRMISAWTVWTQAGAPITYDATFQTAIGGYPQGSIVLSASKPGVRWLATTDQNTTNPDTGGAGWQALLFSVPGGCVELAGSSLFNVPAGVSQLRVRRWGGGGGGGAAVAGTTGTGGGGGAYAEDVMLATPGEQLSFSVGGGGAGGTFSVIGGQGGTTQFARLPDVLGGAGGNSSATAGGAGALASGGSQFSIGGGNGQGGFGGFGGQGGASPMGGQGGGIANGNPGTTATGPGGGGGAAGSTSSQGYLGAAGNPGLIVVSW